MNISYLNTNRLYKIKNEVERKLRNAGTENKKHRKKITQLKIELNRL